MWQNILKSGFVIWAKVDDGGSWVELAREGGSRDNAFEVVKNNAKSAKRTVVGSASEGKVVSMDDGIFENVTEQIIYYVIKPVGDSAPDPSYIPDTSETTTSLGTERRMRGDFGTSERY
jgi:hypothetical protein